MTIEQRARPASACAQRRRSTARSGWLAVAGLLVLSALPVIGGVLRLTEGRGDREGDLLVASLVAIVVHIVAMSAFCVLGALQFSPALRVRRRWHRRVGRVLIPAGLLAALSSVWLVVVDFGGTPDLFAIALVRLVFAIAMAVLLTCSVIAIRGRDFASHGSWMTRAYAIAVSGGTQALVAVLWSIPFGEVDAAGEAVVVAAGFVVNSVVAEMIIRRRRATSGATGAVTVRRG